MYGDLLFYMGIPWLLIMTFGLFSALVKKTKTTPKYRLMNATMFSGVATLYSMYYEFKPAATIWMTSLVVLIVYEVINQRKLKKLSM